MEFLFYGKNSLWNLFMNNPLWNFFSMEKNHFGIFLYGKNLLWNFL